MTLVLKKGKVLDPVPLRSLLTVAGAFVDEGLAEHGEDEYCYLIPFQYSLGEGIDIILWALGDPWTWGQLETILRGLRLYLVDEHRPYSYYFKIHDSNIHGSDTHDAYTQIGWGDIGEPKPWDFLGSPLLGMGPSNSTSKRALPIGTVGPLSTPVHFRIPRSHLILELRPQRAINPQHILAILLTADSWVARKISIFGEGGYSEAIWDYGTGESPFTRLIVWSGKMTPMTWGELKFVVDGLWAFLVELGNATYTYCQIYDTTVEEASQIGWASIVENQSTLENASRGGATLNSTSKRALQISSPAAGLAALNPSQSLSAYD